MQISLYLRYKCRKFDKLQHLWILRMFYFLLFINMSKKSIIDIVKHYFASQPVLKAWLFESFSRGDEREDSDVDIIITLDKEAHVGLLKFSGMRYDLETLLHRNVDLVVDGALMPFAVESADRDKILIYERTC